MADFDAIHQADDEDSNSTVEQYVQIADPVVIRGTGHITL